MRLPGSTYHVEVELIPVTPEREDIGTRTPPGSRTAVAERCIEAGRGAAREALADWDG